MRSPLAENNPRTSLESTDRTPVLEVNTTPWPPVICALTSLAFGPVYVNFPKAESYVNDPSPPASITSVSYTHLTLPTNREV